MTKHYWMYDMNRDFHVTLTDPDATIFDAVQAIRDHAGVEAFGYQVTRSEARANEEVLVV